MAKRQNDDDDYDPVDVDVNHLDREWQAQPRLMRQASVKATKARKAHSEAKAKLDVVTSELGLAIRRTPERFGFSKAPSNDVVDACVIVQPEYQRAQSALIQAKYELDLLEDEVTALSHKKAALENSVILFCRDYGSECKLPKEQSGQAREKMREVTSKGDRWKGTAREIGEGYP